MGGGRRFEYPKWVWSPAGGWWPNPVNWKRNAAIYVGFSMCVALITYKFSERNTVRKHMFYSFVNNLLYGFEAVLYLSRS